MSSTTRGYLKPASSTGLPDGLSLEDFLHTVIYGISGLTDKSLVRPKWQLNPPKTPDILVNWIAFSVVKVSPDANAYVAMNEDDSTDLKRHEALEIQVAFYGANAQENLSIFRDGFQIQQNLEALRVANMGFTGLTEGIRGPDLVNERWRDRWEMSLSLMRQVQRVYPVLAFTSANGTIHTVIDSQEITIDWQAEQEET